MSSRSSFQLRLVRDLFESRCGLSGSRSRPNASCVDPDRCREVDRPDGMPRGSGDAQRTFQKVLKSVPSTIGRLRIPREICPN